MIINQGTGDRGQEPGDRSISKGAVALVVLMLALVVGVVGFMAWRESSSRNYEPKDPVSRHLMFDRTDWESYKAKRDEIYDLEKKGYRFKGSYEVKNWTFLVYEKD